MDVLLAKTDTRVLADDWLNDRVQPGDSLHDAGNGYTRLNVWERPVQRWTYDANARAFNGHDGARRTGSCSTTRRSGLRRGRGGTAHAGVDELRAGLQRARHAGLAGLAVYDPQDAFFLPVSGFNTVERPGPTVSIYRRRDQPPLRQ